MDAKQRRYDGIDFDQLYKRLRVYAEGLTRFMPEVFDGVSAGDLVNDVLLAFWESPDGLGWKPAKGKLVTFLLTVLKNRFIDRYRRTQKMQASLDDPDGGSPEPSCTPIDTLEYQDFLQQLRNRIGERPGRTKRYIPGETYLHKIHRKNYHPFNFLQFVLKLSNFLHLHHNPTFLPRGNSRVFFARCSTLLSGNHKASGLVCSSDPKVDDIQSIESEISEIVVNSVDQFSLRKSMNPRLVFTTAFHIPSQPTYRDLAP